MARRPVCEGAEPAQQIQLLLAETRNVGEALRPTKSASSDKSRISTSGFVAHSFTTIAVFQSLRPVDEQAIEKIIIIGDSRGACVYRQFRFTFPE
ncbi:MAG TPA: hypothetical protein VHX61_02135 [Rhizomicrobium sp.]|nr:hypothetical protein [Rhizomicrobium sp.]